MKNLRNLAELDITEEGRGREELDRLIDYVGKLSEVETAGVEPMVQPLAYGDVLREDVVTNGDEREALMANAPQVMDELFRVPRSI